MHIPHMYLFIHDCMHIFLFEKTQKQCTIKMVGSIFFLLVPCNLSQLASSVLLYYVRRLAKKGPSLYFIYSLLYLERTVELLLFFFS